METKIFQPVVKSFVVEFVNNHTGKASLEDLSVEQRDEKTKEILEKKVSTLSRTAVKQLCSELKTLTGKQKRTSLFTKTPELATFANLVEHFSGDEDYTIAMTKEQCIAFWVRETQASPEKLLSASIDGQVITRVLAIRMCEFCEDITGRQILASESRTPMQYLGEETTFGDVIDYFTVGSKKINDIRCRIFKAAPEYIKAYLAMFRGEVAKAYALNCGLELKDEEIKLFEEKPVFDCKNPDFSGERDWDLPIWWTEDQLGLQLPGKFDWITKKTKAKDVIDAFVCAKETRLKTGKE